MNYFKLLFAVATLGILFPACDGGGDDSTADTIVVVLEASGLSGDKLSVNATASLRAEVIGFTGDASGLSYRWLLSTDRGQLSDGGTDLPNPTVACAAIRCVGKRAGEEKITVEVLDATRSTIGRASLDFEIVTSTTPGKSRGCFDQAKIIYTRGLTYMVVNQDGTNPRPMGITAFGGGNISPDGEWFAYAISDVYYDEMHVVRCDGRDRYKIPGGVGLDGRPEFSPDSKTLYFTRKNPDGTGPDLADYCVGGTRIVSKHSTAQSIHPSTKPLPKIFLLPWASGT